MKSRLLLLPLLLATACNTTSPYVTNVGILKPQATLTVRVGQATVNAFAPQASQRPDLFTIAATALPNGTPPPPSLRAVARDLIVTAPAPLASLLVRVPDRTNLVVESDRGDVNVVDITGDARVVAKRGDVDVMLPGYAQAAVGQGNLKVTMGATQWPGTLHFSTARGDVTLWISARAAFAVHLHTDDGTLFTDFGLRGTSSGSSETIDGVIDGGSQRVDVETRAGTIRLLRLQPQP